MNDSNHGYRPAAPIAVPPIYTLPLRLRACLNWFWRGVVFPYGVFFFCLAWLIWRFVLTEWQTMAHLDLTWVLTTWLRNALLLVLVAGGLHWWLYMRRAQGRRYKFDPRDQAVGKRAFLFGDQVKDNMFWSLASGSLIWSLYEVFTLWLYASGRVEPVAWIAAPWYVAATAVLVIFWGTFHFYWVHRLLHVPPLYRIAHELHHRNVNVGPWSGISMHPIEHLLYFSVFALWWVLPVHPLVVIMNGLYFGLSPAFSHSGFERIRLGGKISLPTGDYFHQLHHRYFEVNYGNTPTPLDKLFGTWHDGSEQSHAQFLARRGR